MTWLPVFLDCFDAAVNSNSTFSKQLTHKPKHWHSWSKWHILSAKGSNRAKTCKICNKSKFCLQTTQLETSVWALPTNHYTVDNKIQNTALCSIACHCSLLLYVAFMPVPFVVTFAFLQRIRSRVRDASMQMLLIPLILFLNYGWKLKYCKYYTKNM